MASFLCTILKPACLTLVSFFASCLCHQNPLLFFWRSQLSACYARNLEHDPSTSPSGERAVSHTLPWTRQRIQQRRRQQEEGADRDGGGGAATAASATATDGISPKAAHLAGDIAPLFDRLGRMLTDVAPHLARLSIRAEDAGLAADAAGSGSSATERGDAAEPGEVPWGALRRQARSSRGGAQRPQGSGRGGGGGGVGNRKSILSRPCPLATKFPLDRKEMSGPFG